MGYFRDYIAKDELKTLSKRSDLMGAWIVIHCWGVIIAAMIIFALFPNPLTFVIGVMIVGSRQLGMAILNHEAAHRTLFNNKALNDFVGQYCLALPFGGDMHAYRKYHLKHHRFTQQDSDPDLVLSAPFPISKSSLARKTLRDLTGLTALRLRAGQLVLTLKGERPVSEILSAVAAQIVIFSICAILGYGWVYFALYLLPLLTWFQLVLRLRNIAEHAMVSREDDPLQNARTTYANWIERCLVAPYWVNYHVEHHAFMFVPCYNLPKAHAALLATEFGEQINTERNYVDVLRLATTG